MMAFDVCCPIIIVIPGLLDIDSELMMHSKLVVFVTFKKQVFQFH